ncbi:cytochrome P450 monooxygenase [Aspergillus costaricaensis CBS 115574]|uniref:Cytochrome P450 monooxygenase n=1 Tax=Aspergillus costaricaensis CBS 115574 TaxID=1448317 RepID=A0ACD1ICW3_9EURO|nr:cytochrome P450 monooxygenase [Aspergillus costaricaensis CBS 115574]RAK88249.1 cytochrome P450 monooxygenase [Aspergillus costaricaensis CBS 115574]
MAVYVPFSMYHAVDIGFPAGPVVIILILLGVVVVASDGLDGWRQRRALKGIPIVDEGSYMRPRLRWKRFDAEKEYASAYQQYSKMGKPYATRMQNDDYAIVLPLNSSKEWRSLPHDKMSFLQALAEFADMNMYCDITDRTPIEAVHNCNNAESLNHFNKLLAQEADKALPLILDQPNGNKWKDLNTFHTILSLCSKITIILLLGPDIAPDPVLLHHLMSFGESIMSSCYRRTGYPRILRPFVWHFSPVCRNLRYHLSILREKLVPVVARQVTAARAAKTINDIRPYSLLDALVTAAFDNGSLSRDGDCTNEAAQLQLLADDLIFYHFELSNPTAFNIIFQLYSIMNHQEYMAPLREEALHALKLTDGDWTAETLKHAPKLESFAKETFRLYDISPLVSFRRVMKPVTLNSIGLSLRPGTITLSPCRGVHLDPEIYEDPTTFDGYRFYDSGRGVCSPRVATTSLTFLTFSHGAGSCPARVLATQICRTIFIKFLLQYDVELAQKETFPYGFTSGPVYLPNPSVTMRIRPRSDGK